MVSPESLEQYFGFTEDEVLALCQKHGLDSDEMMQWYNGYRLGMHGVRVFNPTSVMTVLTTRVYKGYWTQTESFESVRSLINMNFDGVKEALEQMLIEKPTKVTVTTFGNDSNVINSKDELFTLMIHYGYLGYDALNQRVYIPNWEVRQELIQAIKNGSRPELVKLIKDSEQLLADTVAGNEEAVSKSFDELHERETAPQFYNNEQALRSLIHIAYLASLYRQLPPSGRCMKVNPLMFMTCTPSALLHRPALAGRSEKIGSMANEHGFIDRPAIAGR